MNQRHAERQTQTLAFDYQPITRVVFGNGSVERLGELARELGGKHVLVVSDPGIKSAGHVDRAAISLEKAGLTTTLFVDVQENPTTRHVEACRQVAQAAGIDLIVGIGGGSSMDTAKGANFLLTNGGKMADYWGVGKATKPMLPMIAIPTTAGTGSEAQSFALIADDVTHAKMACGDKKAACKIAILDPELTVSQPAGVTADSGIDAISHALESYVTTKRNPISTLFAGESWELLRRGYPRVLAEPTDVEARGLMLLGANLAGSAIENSMLGATHSAANPLTAHYGLAHGIAIALMLPAVIRFNGPVCGHLYAELLDGSPGGDPAARLADEVSELIRLAGLPSRLSERGVDRHSLSTLAQEAAKQWTAHFNPRPITAADFLRLYEEVF